RRHTRWPRDWSSDVCSSDLEVLAEHPHFVPSLAEAGEDFSGTQLHYSVDTVRYFRHAYHGDGDRIFFIIGADAFLDIPVWKEYEIGRASCRERVCVWLGWVL